MDNFKNNAPPAEANKLHFLDYWRIIRIRKTVILAVFLLVVITATVVTFILPEAYMSTARIKVEKPQTDITPLFGPQGASSYDPYFIQTEFEVIQSQKILYQVIDQLDLNTAWGKKYAGGDKLKTQETYSILKRMIDLRPTRNTSLIEIRVYSEDKDEAANIANTIAQVYSDYRLSVLQKQASLGIEQLEKDYTSYEKKVTEAQNEVDTLRTKYNIVEVVDESGSAASATIDKDTVRRLEGQRVDAERLYSRDEALLNDLKSKKVEELKNILPTVTSDPLLQGYMTDLATAQSKLVSMEQSLGKEHPDVKATAAVVADLTQKVNDRVNGTLIGLQAKVNAEKTDLDTITDEVKKARSSDTTRTAENRPYYDAKRRLEQLQNFQKLLQTKIAAEQVEMNLPKTGMVEIVDKGEPGLKPVKPNKPLNIALGVIIGLIVGVGLAFFIEYLDTSVKTIDDVEHALQAPVLGVIPQNVGRLIEEGAESPHAEAYRVLRTNLLFSRKDEKLNSMAIVSAGAGEGKSTTLFNLATVFAQSGQRVIVVDSDLRRPSLHKFMRVSNNLGLTNYLLKQNTLDEVIQTSSLPTLDFMSSGKLPSSSMGILSSTQMRALIGELKQRYDFVFFDSPPIMGVSDASILASEVDMTMQVIQYRRYPQAMNIRAKQLIEKVGGNLMGIVLNNINMAQDESYYYYSGYYHEYYSKNDDDEAAAAKKSKKDGKEALDIKQKY